MNHTIITHTDAAGYCTGVAAFDIAPQQDGAYDTLITHGDRTMCGFDVRQTEHKQLTGEQLGALVGNHIAFTVFASGAAVTREWVIRSTALLSRLRDPVLLGAFRDSFGQSEMKVSPSEIDRKLPISGHD